MNVLVGFVCSNAFVNVSDSIIIPNMFRDASMARSSYNLTVLDCLHSLSKVRESLQVSPFRGFRSPLLNETKTPVLSPERRGGHKNFVPISCACCFFES